MVGEFAIVKDQWQGKEVSYYVAPAFAPHARAIFGKTPAMLDFFSQKLGIAYPWNKYAQAVVQHFVSGAMENTTASVFYDYVQVDARSLQDEHHESIIAHELMHQWFGNLVTCENWAYITLNELLPIMLNILGRAPIWPGRSHYLGLEHWQNYLSGFCQSPPAPSSAPAMPTLTTF
ncbi:MAG: M1 family metallopeptidase [Microscillaceae bacterium]|nr:M1 family metallopeptidase [Microscillaceae bacterium]